MTAQVGLIAVNLLGEIAADEEQHHLHAEVQQQQQQLQQLQLQLQPGERPPSSIAGVGMGVGFGGGGSALGARPPSTLPPEPQVCLFFVVLGGWAGIGWTVLVSVWPVITDARTPTPDRTWRTSSHRSTRRRRGSWRP
jgi:hypothetical protein